MEHTRWRTLNRPPQNHTIHHSECEYWKLPSNSISYIILDSDWSWVCREQHSSVMETKGFNFLLKVTLCWTFHFCKWTENRAATQHIREGGVDWSLRIGGAVTNLREVFAPFVTSQKQNKQKLWIVFSCASLWQVRDPHCCQGEMVKWISHSGWLHFFFSFFFPPKKEELRMFWSWL